MNNKSFNKNIKVLDCTLRDGGRIIDCAFSDEEIKQISLKLANSKIDIIEIGFLRDKNKVKYAGNSTFFTDVDQIKPFLDKNKSSMYAAFIDYGMFDFTTLKECDGESIEGIRFGFTKKDYSNNILDIIEKLHIIKEKGYKLFIQTVNSLNYTEEELLTLIGIANQLNPYSFGIVDTYGAMYVDDVNRLYKLVDANLNKDICIDFHSHNNYQLSFAFSQEIIKLSEGKRNIILDATLHGMAKGAGNLNTELLVDFLVREMHYDYEFDNILDIIDEHIYDYRMKYNWGYSIPSLMASIYKSHPNNIIYLTEKFRLDTKDIKYIMSMIDPETRQLYNYDNIEKLYIEYVATKTNDYTAIENLKEIINGQEVLVMVPGITLGSYNKEIGKYIGDYNPFIITVNFIMETYKNAVFFGNQKRYNNKDSSEIITIISSNIKSTNENDILINYESLIMRENEHFDNSTIMLLNLLRRIGITKISIAGFDGYVAGNENFIFHEFDIKRFEPEYEKINIDIREMFTKFVKTISGKCLIKFITPSMFENILE